MTDLIEAVILGIVQGLTEFLPVSSSGHLEIAKYLLKDDSFADQSVLTTVFLHFATAIATLLVFRKDVSHILRGIFQSSGKEERWFSLYIIISMIPAVFVGLFFEELIDPLFDKNMMLVGICLLITAFLLWFSEYIQPDIRKLNGVSAFIMGAAQAVAILPGISRSGATISTALLLGLNKEQAARFSFLMVIPIIFGKIAKDLISGEFQSNMPSMAYLLAGFLAAFFTGVFACKAMIAIVKRSGLHWFSLYCIVIGILAIIAALS